MSFDEYFDLYFGTKDMDTKKEKLNYWLTSSYLSENDMYYLYIASYPDDNNIETVDEADIPMDQYLEFLVLTADLESDKDRNGKTISGSKKAKIVNVINSLDLYPDQKDVLYQIKGYSANTLNDAPWH